MLVGSHRATSIALMYESLLRIVANAASQRATRVQYTESGTATSPYITTILDTAVERSFTAIAMLVRCVDYMSLLCIARNVM